MIEAFKGGRGVFVGAVVVSIAVALVACGSKKPAKPPSNPDNDSQGKNAAIVTSDAGDGTAAPEASAPDAPSSNSQRAVIVISIDGLRHDYLDVADRAPAMVRMAHQGALAKQMRSIWPTLTYPAHTTLVTGVRPSKHGIVNNLTFDPYDKNEHGWMWYSADIRVPTLWDAAHDANVTTGNVYWPVTVGANIRYNVPQIWRSKIDEDDKLLRALSTPDALPPDKAVPAEHRTDRERADAVISMIERDHPRLMFVYFTDLDTEQHKSGPFSPASLAMLKKIDGYVDEVVNAAHAKYPALSVALVSDHGFSEVTKDIRPNVTLHQKKWLSAKKDKITGYRAVTWKAGGTAGIMLKDPADTDLKTKIIAAFEALAKDPKNGIAKVYDGKTIEDQGGFPGVAVVLDAKPGFQFTDNVEGPLVVPSKYRGTHGYSPDDPEMKCTFFLWGDGVKKGDLGDVDMIDVAPTIAALLDLKLPSAEGKPIEAALAR